MCNIMPVSEATSYQGTDSEAYWHIPFSSTVHIGSSSVPTTQPHPSAAQVILLDTPVLNLSAALHSSNSCNTPALSKPQLKDPLHLFTEGFGCSVRVLPPCRSRGTSLTSLPSCCPSCSARGVGLHIVYRTLCLLVKKKRSNSRSLNQHAKLASEGETKRVLN